MIPSTKDQFDYWVHRHKAATREVRKTHAAYQRALADQAEAFERGALFEELLLEEAQEHQQSIGDEVV